MMIDRTQLAEFLRRRREALQPEDVGMPRGQRRRTRGLRREEVAVLCHMSTDYYSRLEQERGPQPSEQMIASIAQGLHLTVAERDHLFRLAGHQPPAARPEQRARQPRHAADLRPPHRHPGRDRHRARRDAAADTAQGRPRRRLDPLHRARAQQRLPLVHRPRQPGTSTCPRTTSSSPACTPPACAASPPIRGPGSRAAELADLLLEQSEEFRTLWADHEIGIEPDEVKRYQHPEVGRLDLNCQVLFDPHQSHRLLVYTADPGTESYEKLQMLTVIGAQHMSSS